MSKSSLSIYSIVSKSTNDAMIAVAKTPRKAAQIALDVWRGFGVAPDGDEIIKVNPCIVPDSLGMRLGKVTGGGGGIIPVEPTTKYKMKGFRVFPA